MLARPSLSRPSYPVTQNIANCKMEIANCSNCKLPIAPLAVLSILQFNLQFPICNSQFAICNLCEHKRDARLRIGRACPLTLIDERTVRV
jgi:hypothetical protein